MSGTLKDFFRNAQANFNLKNKFAAAWAAGSRILPSRSAKNDANYELRIDAGELINNRHRNLVLQVNSQAKNTTLKEWVRKNGSHAKLATASFDTEAEDPDEEVKRVIAELERQAKDNI